ncbi:hypothetical protein A1L58_16715 [Shewanella baltica]|uniref:hypothetical protein n=1 Tax=Shewanella baltica TaxID=62322 RepID=UPI0007B46972|nr:hypothetical protein [Shewanella baltica]KZK69138.1 hypothetical protein A1L58_16715 [Shewanella baltica]
MNEHQPLMVPIDPEELSLPAPNEGVDNDVAEKRRKALEKNATCVENRESGSTSFELGFKQEGVKDIMNFETDADANIFITDLKDEDIVSGVVMAGAMVQKAVEMGEDASNNGNANAVSDAKDTLACLFAASDNENMVNERLIAAQRNIDEWPKTRRNVLNSLGAADTDFFGEPLEENPAVHHKVLKSVKPEHTLNKENLKPANKKPHTKNHAKMNIKGKKLVDENMVCDPNSLIGCTINTP